MSTPARRERRYSRSPPKRPLIVTPPAARDNNGVRRREPSPPPSYRQPPTHTQPQSNHHSDRRPPERQPERQPDSRYDRYADRIEPERRSDDRRADRPEPDRRRRYDSPPRDNDRYRDSRPRDDYARRDDRDDRSRERSSYSRDRHYRDRSRERERERDQPFDPRAVVEQVRQVTQQSQPAAAPAPVPPSGIHPSRLAQMSAATHVTPDVAPAAAAAIAAIPTGDMEARTKQIRRLYIGNIPSYPVLTDDQLNEYFTAAAKAVGVTTPVPVAGIWLAKDQAYCFVEFRSYHDAEHCFKELQNISMANRVLRVGRSSQFAPPSTAEEAEFVLPITSEQQTRYEIQQRQMQMNGSTHPPTRNLLLANVVRTDDLQSSEELSDIKADLYTECSKFGQVDDIQIGSIVKDEKLQQQYVPTFIIFSDLNNARAAKNALQTRVFNGQKVEASYASDAEVRESCVLYPQAMQRIGQAVAAR